ncbi:MAG TPA: prolipoprotein diacylglyceryl transferase family protein [Candidatus Binatia bacterium]|nr:prolipoprotein diacylglyceryl transferase family protein [Candidatus Binatia bacterium]
MPHPSAYGAFAATGCIVAVLWLKAHRGRLGLSENAFWAAVWTMLLGAVIGAKGLFVALGWEHYARGELRFWRDFGVGFVFFGGLAGAAIAGAIFARARRLSFVAGADYFAVAVPMGHSIGRVGCFFAGCCGGRPPHPVQLYEAAALAGIAWLCRRPLARVETGELAAGTAFRWYLVLYGAVRLLLDPLRADGRPERFLGLSHQQGIALAIVALALLARPWGTSHQAPIAAGVAHARGRAWTNARLALLLMPLAALALATGCGDRRPGEPAPPLDAAGCAALATPGFPATEVTSADWLEGAQLAGTPLPPHCRLRGVIDRRVGRDGVPYGIGFELRLPRDWKRRFYFQGGYGTDGVITPAVGSLGGGTPLARGFAAVSTDAGHSGDGVEFGLDPQARLDYGYNAIDRVTRTARAIIARAYGREPERSYLVGCSGGGRQGFVAAERFPDFFDGIVAGAPGFDLPKAGIAEAWNTQAVAAIATAVGADGQPRLGDTFSDDDLALLQRALLDRCDGNDGLVDGVVDDLPACHFDPAVLACPGAKDATCLSLAQVAALARIFGGPRNSRGEALYSDFPWDGGIGDPGPIASLRAWTLGRAGSPTNDALNVTLGAGILAFISMTPPVATTDTLGFALGFDFDRDAPRIFAAAGEYAQSSMEFLSAGSTDLAPFRRRGGKMIVYHGASDGVFSANDTIRWYEALDASNGGRAADFARLFVVPNMGHCVGGPSTDQFDAFAAVVAWVEDGVPPDRIDAKASASSRFAGRSRPLCPYPKQSRYRGEGSTESADSFVCR